LRTYFIAAFQLAPGELTTTEFSRALANSEQVGAGLAAEAAAFLRDCDDRKFAPTPTPAPLGAADRALQLVALAEERRAKLRQPVAGQTQGARA
jgi:hypothetical protein